jgi:two-component system, OmpR family, sensor kinase
MSRWSLRRRLAAASAAAVLVALALLGIAATLVVEDQLRATVDRDLRRRAVDVAQLAAVTPGILQSRGALNRMLDALDQARESERRLLADASHELRTPVTSLRGNAAFARRHGADEELLVELEADAERLARLVDDLLALEREAGAERPDAEVDLEAVIDAVVAAPGHRLDESPLLDALSADRLPPRAPHVVVRQTAPLAVRGQAGALERALRNLVENAAVHGPAGGEIRVALARRGDEAVLSVADDGPGIPPALAADAARRFWRGPDAGGRPGSGLGLAIVAATAARHGGRLEIDGATVAISLPLVKELSRPARTFVA